MEPRIKCNLIGGIVSNIIRLVNVLDAIRDITRGI